MHDAYQRGDLAALKALLDHPPDFPNCRGPAGAGAIILEYAIYHSPLAFIRTLLEQGADPNNGHGGGFPALVAALARGRPERYEIVWLLLVFAADVEARVLNDWTPLRLAAACDDLEGIRLLLARDADPTARTRIDALATPLEEAEHLGRATAAERLRQLMRG
jgi:uncharacterized protein